MSGYDSEKPRFQMCVIYAVIYDLYDCWHYYFWRFDICVKYVKTDFVIVAFIVIHNCIVVLAGCGVFVHLQLSRIYLDMLNVYKVISENVSVAIATNGENVTKQPLIKSMRTVKKETLKLISSWVGHSNDPQLVRITLSTLVYVLHHMSYMYIYMIVISTLFCVLNVTVKIYHVC